jgi:hypothetical protein
MLITFRRRNQYQTPELFNSYEICAAPRATMITR